MAEDPQVLSSDDSPVASSSLSQLWARLHCISGNLHSQDRALSTVQANIVDQQNKSLTLASLVHEVRCQVAVARAELDQVQQKVQGLEDRIARCERCLNLDALD